MISSIIRWLLEHAAVLALLNMAAAALLIPLGFGDAAGSCAFLLAALISALIALSRWPAPSVAVQCRKPLKGIISLAIIACAIGLGYGLWWLWQPHFTIAAIGTLDNDPNAYEVTDQLIWNQDTPAQYGVGITFTLEIVPAYYAKQQFGKVVALISGDGGDTLEKPLWNAFTNGATAQQITLTLPELLRVSGLRTNAGNLANPFSPGGRTFQQARLVVQVAQAAKKAQPWSTAEIAIRNAPWEVRSELATRDDRPEADVYVRNLGGAGDFTVRYRLVRLDKEIDTSSLPEVSGTTYITAWNQPRKLVSLNRGESFTDTVSVPDGLAQGRYLLEIYAAKKQNYVQFADPKMTWDDLNSLSSPWWFGEYPSDKQVFVVTDSQIPIPRAIQAEWQRVKDDLDVDLGLVLKPAEDVTSLVGTQGQRQVFQKGEVYLRDGQAYALYGPILEHYTALEGIQDKMLGFPTSGVQAVTSVSGAQGYVAEFESSPPQAHTMIYASNKGVAEVEGWISDIYQKNGGPAGWLGFPLADMQEYPDSVIQMFEYGYIVYYYPEVAGERDWTRTPGTYPYLASLGTLFDVHAEQPWQDTGVQVQPGDRITIIQVGGAWTYRDGESQFDANGTTAVPLQQDAPLPSVAIGTLIGKVGEGNDLLFPVRRWGVVAAPAGGNLDLAMNDNGYSDNVGFITVQIMVEHPK
jgi:hypothetical protein